MKFSVKLVHTVAVLSPVDAFPVSPNAVTGVVNTDEKPISPQSAACSAQQIDWAQVDQILGRTTITQPSGVRRYGFPRSDMNVTVRGTAIKSRFALGGRAAFKLSGSTAVVMGDLALTDEELNPVMLALQKRGVQTTAVHNQLLLQTPPVKYLHFRAQGSPAAVANSLHAALSLTKTPLAATASSNTSSTPPFNTTALDSAIGCLGKNNGGVYQYNVPRTEIISDGDTVLPVEMGVGTVINFQPTGNNSAAITGDLTLLSAEVPLVLRALGEHSIQVNAVHSHMLTDSPHPFYIHFWAVGDVVKLGQGLRNALAQKSSAKPSA